MFYILTVFTASGFTYCESIEGLLYFLVVNRGSAINSMFALIFFRSAILRGYKNVVGTYLVWKKVSRRLDIPVVAVFWAWVWVWPWLHTKPWSASISLPSSAFSVVSFPCERFLFLNRNEGLLKLVTRDTNTAYTFGSPASYTSCKWYSRTSVSVCPFSAWTSDLDGRTRF